MIIATILKNYKCYKGINVLLFSDKSHNFLNIIIGNNGVGKSAILEGLDTLFNDARWIINNASKSKNETQTGALFLLNKSKVKGFIDAKELVLLEGISNFFWNFTPSMVPFKGYEHLFDIRDYHKEFDKTHYLVFLGKTNDSKNLGFLSFDKSVRNALTVEPKPSDSIIHRLLSRILAMHAYIYIPIETSVSDFVKLQNMSMQMLMDRQIKDALSKSLQDKRIARTKGKTTKKLSLLDLINEILEEYVNSVETDIKNEYDGYSYRPKPNQSSKLTVNHVADTIIEAYYSKRVFKKDGKLIEDLSYGEKRLILVDIISAFIQKNNPSRELIVAIDEPESSLHISKCYEQFSKINRIAIEFHHQIFVTTHWYGSLPVLKCGGLIHIADNAKANYCELMNYFEKRGDLPNDIQLKGYFDLSSSLLYAFRNSKQTMILVEGFEDKRYLEYYLSTENLVIIPVGGCSNVKKIFGYLYTPMSDKEMIPKSGNYKIICLIDTDISCPTIGFEKDLPSNILMMRRLHQEDNEVACIIKCDDNKKNPTEVEEVLEPLLFYKSVDEAIQEFATNEEKETWNYYEFNANVNNSRIKGDYSILKSKSSDRDLASDKSVISSFIDSHKDEIAQKYINQTPTGNVPKWIEELERLCNVDLRR